MRHLPLLLLVLGSCGGAGEPQTTAARPPDVLLVVIDTLRADRLGCYGYDRPTSPTLDRLAARGALFLDNTAQSPWTKPSMVSLMQSRYITEYRDTPLEGAPTLAELFNQAGYRSLAFVGNALLSHRAGFNRGWHHYDARRRSITDPTRQQPGRDFAEILEAAREPISRVLTRDPDRLPVLLYLHAMDPHDPYLAHPQFDPELSATDAAKRWPFTEQRTDYGAGPKDRRAAAVWNQMAEGQAHYDQEIREVDQRLGALLAELEARGAADNLLIVIAADHGEGLWDHRDPRSTAQRPDHVFFQTHGHYLFEELLRTPLILSGGGVPEGLRIAAPVQNVDLLPTLLELCGIEAPAGLHGRSLGPLLRDPGGTPDQDVFAFVLGSSSVREATTSLKLIQPDQGPARLFNLAHDPLERHDLATARPDDVQRMTAKLTVWRRQYPLETSLGRQLSEQTAADMAAMGYTGIGGEEQAE
jgi:arylsulfatase A-like enzyme